MVCRAKNSSLWACGLERALTEVKSKVKVQSILGLYRALLATQLGGYGHSQQVLTSFTQLHDFPFHCYELLLAFCPLLKWVKLERAPQREHTDEEKHPTEEYWTHFPALWSGQFQCGICFRAETGGGGIWKWVCIGECSTKSTHHKIYVIIFISEMLHQLLKALLFSADLKHKLLLCLWRHKHKHSKISDRNFSTNNYLQNTFFYLPYTLLPFLQSWLATKGRSEADEMRTLGFFSLWLWCYQMCASTTQFIAKGWQ